MKLKKLLKGIDVRIDSRLLGLDITSISANSEDVKKGGLFVAIEGSKLDGHKFVREAFEKGAAVSLVETRNRVSFGKQRIIKVADTRKALSVAAKNFYRAPSEKLKVIGITGTNGKTTTSLLIESIFNKSGVPCGVIGTIEYRLSKACRIPAGRTTPDALLTNALLDQMLRRKLKAVAIEVSSHALDQKRVDDIFFDTAIFTNLTHEHLDYHGNLKRYFESKIKIFTNLKKKGVAVINTDDNIVGACIKKLTGHKIISYGLNNACDVSAKIGSLALEGSSFAVKLYKKKAFSVDTKLPGLHNISNILASIASGAALGLNSRSIKEGIESVDSIPGRLERVKNAKKFKVFVDYAHTHAALENVLGFLNRVKQRKIITVFGCGGDRDSGKRPLMGKIAQELSDFVIITNDNPRHERPEKIARDIEHGINKKKNNYTILLNRKKAIEHALEKADVGDIVLIAGKGHEKFQIVGDMKIPFDDKKTAEAILKCHK